jgi:hypothetical protein
MASNHQTQENRQSNSKRTAKALLARLRQTPMSRGSRLTAQRRLLQEEIAASIESQEVPARLAWRIAFQLILKCDVTELRERAVWLAIGQLLKTEIRRLRAGIGLVERQIVVVLPKLSPDRIEDLFEELRAADPSIARTIMNAAFDAAEPISMSRRYLTEFHRLTEALEMIDPDVARTLANGTFMARLPHKKAIVHLRRFAELVRAFQGDVECARTVARAAFRAPDPIRAAQLFIADYNEIVTELTLSGLERQIARTLAAVASMSADPMATAYRLVQNFEDVLRLANKTHPWVARSIALSACRSANPLSTATSYMSNYDTIVRLVSVTDTHRARQVAAQVFRSDDPIRWARRYLATLHRNDTGQTADSS